MHWTKTSYHIIQSCEQYKSDDIWRRREYSRCDPWTTHSDLVVRLSSLTWWLFSTDFSSLSLATVEPTFHSWFVVNNGDFFLSFFCSKNGFDVYTGQRCHLLRHLSMIDTGFSSVNTSDAQRATWYINRRSEFLARKSEGNSFDSKQFVLCLHRSRFDGMPFFYGVRCHRTRWSFSSLKSSLTYPLRIIYTNRQSTNDRYQSHSC